ncbi:MAG: hypothetical protein EGQ16_03410, partial [Clostridiales bacterium]|nr:hypothetical protein [Clostridiales bacterium]
EEVDTTTDYYVHPAFTNESSIGYANGGWDKELTGIWVAKFEAGYASGNNNAPVKASSVNYTQMFTSVSEIEAGSEGVFEARNWLDGIYATKELKADGENYTYSWKNGNETAIKYPTFQPKTYSMNYININDSYNISKILTEDGNIYGLNSSTTDSHLMKNSEWGAIAYLAQSKYGNNGIEPYINNISLNSGNRVRKEDVSKHNVDGIYAITGVTTGLKDSWEKVVEIENINNTTGNRDNNGVYTWNQKIGQKSSTTLNMYGVFDMNGGTWERTAGYIANKSWQLDTYGSSLIEASKKDAKEVTIYAYNSGNDEIKENYLLNSNIYGNAINEISDKGEEATSWNKDYSCFPALGGPFTTRGGYLWDGFKAGIFAFQNTDGSSNWRDGFRVVLMAS